MAGRAYPMLPFRDRREAGRLLAEALRDRAGLTGAVVVALPRGGIVPAAEIAGALGLPLDVLISRKLGAPGNPEYAIGAVAEGGEPYVSRNAVRLSGASETYVAEEVARQRDEIARRQRRFRGGRPPAFTPGAPAILVDDGVATGSTAIAAIQALRRLGVARVVFAVPVAPPDTAARLRAMVDELVVLVTPIPFRAVGLFYDDFTQVSDEEVAALLAGERSGAHALAGADDGRAHRRDADAVG